MTRYRPGIYTIRNGNTAGGVVDFIIDSSPIQSPNQTWITVNVTDYMHFAVTTNLTIYRVGDCDKSVIGNVTGL